MQFKWPWLLLYYVTDMPYICTTAPHALQSPRQAPHLRRNVSIAECILIQLWIAVDVAELSWRLCRGILCGCCAALRCNHIFFVEAVRSRCGVATVLI